MVQYTTSDVPYEAQENTILQTGLRYEVLKGISEFLSTVYEYECKQTIENVKFLLYSLNKLCGPPWYNHTEV